MQQVFEGAFVGIGDAGEAARFSCELILNRKQLHLSFHLHRST